MIKGNLLPENEKKISVFGRMIIFISLLLVAISPLTLLNNKTTQFLCATIILILALFLNAKYLDKRPFSAYGLTLTKNNIGDSLIGILIGAVAVCLTLVVGTKTGKLLVSIAPNNLNLHLLLLFGLKMLFVAIIEESIYRGYFFTNLHEYFRSNTKTKHSSLYLAVLASSALFGLAHLGNNNASVISISFLVVNGIVWCIPFVLTRNLGLSIGMHFSWNFFQTFFGFTMSGNKATNSLLLIKNNGSEIWNGGEYGPEAGLLGIVGIITMLLLTVTYVHFKTT